ncbi:TonB-dependent receptor plug domain-containing protein [Silanimonas sp.]|uniref:TonB-dependent receptor plug domain-containing protein n=1 Tax=Silanimonas sp. TaxID=1929290 RepID=UPI0037C99D23
MSPRWVLPIALGFGATAAQAQPSAEDLLDLELQQLLELPVSVASRSEQRSADAAAAVFVIDQATLRRSGIQRLPDALRLVPGLHVGKWDGNKWAIASRNAMSRFTSTMLLLVDGRPAYTPLFGGVRWETFDLPIDEIERIEVVRGPGGPLWGANAVDGIISIVTRRSDATLGQRIAVGLGEGDVDRFAEARTGQRLGDWTWRLGLRWMDSAPGLLPPIGQSAWTAPRAVGDEGRDEGRFRTAMLRFDSPEDRPGGALTAWLGHREGRFIDQRLVGGLPRDNLNWFDLDYAAGEWRRGLADGQALALRASLQRLDLGDATLDDTQRVVDVDLQHSGTHGRHAWTWGLGYNHYRSETRTPQRSATPPCTGCFGAEPPIGTDAKRSVFAQTQSDLGRGWTLIAGAKVEDSRSMDWDTQPTVRLRWQPGFGGTFWGGWTRALRSSTRLERDGALFNVPANLAPAFGCRRYEAGTCIIGNPSQPPWQVEVAELGWRQQLSPAFSLDATAFESRYADMATTPGSRVRDRVHGVEVVTQWLPSERWSVDASLTWHRGRDRFIGQPGRIDTFFLPELSGQVHVQWSPSDAIDVDLRWWRGDDRASNSARIGALPGEDRIDLRLAWRPSPGWETALSIGNANDTRAVEYLESLRVNTAVPRSITWSVAWSPP